jgi:orotate phosphoribosyltransferase
MHFPQETARILLQTQSVLFQPDQPFLLTSGRVAPVYVDCRRLISFPRQRALIIDMAVELLLHEAGSGTFDVIAGGETAGIPFAAWIAERMTLPMIYIRKSTKGFGSNTQIEGVFRKGEKVLLVEDLMTDGGTKRVFINALQTAGALVKHCFVVFCYENSLSSNALKGVKLHALTSWDDVITEAERGNFFSPEAIASVRQYLIDPNTWALVHSKKC